MIAEADPPLRSGPASCSDEQAGRTIVADILNLVESDARGAQCRLTGLVGGAQ